MTTPPKTLRYCRKCGAKTEHISSGLFRVNANQKNLDVWLIYRCSKCNNTWNSTIFSRVNRRGISEKLLEKFQNNDEHLALQYAMDIDILKRNGTEVGMPEYEIIGSDVVWEVKTRLEIQSDYPAKVKLIKILREKLKLSHQVFNKMLDHGSIWLDDGSDIRKAKLQQDYVVWIDITAPDSGIK